MTTTDQDTKPAADYQRGAAFGASMFHRMHDAGKSPDYIEARHQEAMEAAREDAESGQNDPGEQEFTRGYAEAMAGRSTLRAVQRAERAAEQWEREAG